MFPFEFTKVMDMENKIFILHLHIADLVSHIMGKTSTPIKIILLV